MKKYFFCTLALLAAACTDDGPEKSVDQQLTCRIAAPENGARIDLTQPMTIRGEAAAEAGKVSAVRLTVGGEVIAEVTSAPFTYEYVFASDRKEGPLTIVLEAEGDAGGRASAEITVELFAPQPQEQHASCALTEPSEGAVVELTQTLTVKGEGSVDIGAVSEVELRIGGKPVESVTSAPFSYEHVFETGQAAGPLKITLFVKGDSGGEASAEVNITLKEPAPQPGTDEMVDARDNRIYRTVKIGEQTWMAENLAYLPVVNNAGESSRDEGSEGKPFYYVLNYDGNDVDAAKATAEYAAYGVLYNWYAAMNMEDAQGADETAVPSGVQGVCPDGWHLPSKAEWGQLEEYVASRLPDVDGNGWYNDFDGEWVFESGLKNVWSALAAVDGGWGESRGVQENPDLAAGPRDTYGFGVIPAGGYYPNGTTLEQKFAFYDSNTSFWLTHKQTYGGGIITFTNLTYNPDYSRFGNQSERGQSVRCVKD